MNILVWFWFLSLSLSLNLDRRSRIFGAALPLPPHSPIVTEKCDEQFLLGQTLNKKYRIVKKLGVGGNSVVYLGNYKHQNFAVKCLINDAKSAYLAEITPMMKLNHPNILKVVDTFATGGKYFIVTELCEMDLHEAIFERDDIQLDVKRIYLQVLDAVIYLHKNNVFHSDLKPQNILLSSLKQPVNGITLISGYNYNLIICFRFVEMEILLNQFLPPKMKLILPLGIINIAQTQTLFKRNESNSLENYITPPQSTLAPGVEKCSLELLLGQKLNRKYRIEKLLGKGGNGRVFLGQYNGQNFSVKCLFKTTTSQGFASSMELFVLGKLDHPNILHLVDSFYVKELDHAFIVTELCETDLYDAIFVRKMQLDIKQVFTSILDAVVFLHENNIFHQDLKPKNILITSLRNQTIKVADFGSATTNKTFNGKILARLPLVAIRRRRQLLRNSLSQLLNDVLSSFL